MATSFFFLLCLLGCLGFASLAQIIPQQGSKEQDRITGLPGQPRNFEFGQFAGSVVVNDTLGSALFYYFVEAAGPKNSMPLLLWLNGGPLVSSLMGLIEHGPYRIASDGKTLYENIYSWNKVANVLYLESPVGVGFSYCNTTSELLKNDDKRTADMNYVFLLNWLERFPEYKHREFYIAGESYAGHYVPQLAQTIVQRTIPGNDAINLTGILIGNPTIDPDSEAFAQEQFFAAHNMISPVLFERLRTLCIDSTSPPQDECQNLVDLCYAERGNKFSLSNILTPICTSSGMSITTVPKPFSVYTFDPCRLHYLATFFNIPEVRTAIHAPAFVSEWGVSTFSDQVDYLSSKYDMSMLPVLKDLLDHKIRVLLFSGDLDAKIPTIATFKAIQKLNLTEKGRWGSWSLAEDDPSGAGGYAAEYEGGLSFSTVRGAGHEVPEYQPARALVLVKSFLEGKGAPPRRNNPSTASKDSHAANIYL